ncbi:MAG: hypothetical protein SP1CHLAM54_06290 [Chlamydiia bacterium]|nr:hypothetical protein [Chlamydiia bacterium]MCH9615539.1 hypothetical protein [Chlamydiia bacterium]MCH9629194.1 hypothetical protein [Chlamydiia bacterium]
MIDAQAASNHSWWEPGVVTVQPSAENESFPWWVIDDNPLPEEIYAQGDPGGMVRLAFNTLQDMHVLPGGTQATNAVGLPVVFAIGTGYMAAVRGYHQLHAALKVDDTHGEEMARITIARGIVESIGGLEFTPYRILGMFHQTAGSTLDKVSTWIARFGLIIFSGIYALLSAPSWMVMGQKRRFWQKAGPGPISPEYFMKYIGVQEKDFTEAYQKVFAKKKIDVIPRVDPRMKPELLSRIDTFVNTKMDGLFSQGEKDTVKRKMANYLLTKMDKREMKLSRVIGAKPVAELRMHDLLGSELTPELKTSLTEVIEKGSTSETRKHTMIIVACLVGIIAFTAANLSLGGLPSGVMGGLAGGAALIFLVRYMYKARSQIHWKALATIVTVATILAAVTVLGLMHGGPISAVGDGLMAMTSFTMLFVDGYYLKQAMKTTKVNNKMRMALLAITVLSVLFGIAGMAVAGSPEALAMAGIATSLWVVTGGISYYMWKKAQERQEEIREDEIRPNIAPQYGGLV